MSRVGSTIPFELILSSTNTRASELITRSPDPGSPPSRHCADKRRYSTDSGIPASSIAAAITMCFKAIAWAVGGIRFAEYI